MINEEVSESDIAAVVSEFYEAVRCDPQLGPIFNRTVDDWDDHLARLGDFWSSVLIGSGRYKGNPVAMHMMHARVIEPAMYSRWLELWTETTNRLLAPGAALLMQAKAARIADRLVLATNGPGHVVKARWPSDVVYGSGTARAAPSTTSRG